MSDDHSSSIDDPVDVVRIVDTIRQRLRDDERSAEIDRRVAFRAPGATSQKAIVGRLIDVARRIAFKLLRPTLEDFAEQVNRELARSADPVLLSELAGRMDAIEASARRETP